MHQHLDAAATRAKDALATILAAATASGGVDAVRDTMHTLAGIWGDCAAVLVSLLTVVWWGIRLADTIVARLPAGRAKRLLGGIIGSSTDRP